MKKIILLLLISFSMAVAAKSNLMQKKHELKHMGQQIESTNQDLNQSKHQRDHLEEELKTLEVSMGKVSQDLTELEGKTKQKLQNLTELKQKEDDYISEINQQRMRLKKQIRTSYLLGQRSFIKTFLNQEDPHEINRLTRYHRYIALARLHAIDDLTQLINEITQTKNEIQQNTLQYQQLRESELTQQQTLKEKLDQRKEVMTKLDVSIASKTEKLKVLVANREALQHVIDKLKTQSTPSLSDRFKSFTAIKGKFSWPTKGHLVQHYGGSLAQNGLTYNGVLIGAAAGQAVHAINTGKVVFADWLRGLGLLIIIDHGKGFMSLYGHNKSLLKKVNDTVNTGDTIATVGNSGGYESPGLYFQLRKNGQVINPEKYCR